MNCPVCSNRHLAVEVLFRGMVPCTFGEGGEFELADEAGFSSEWNDESRCECLICGWEGTLQEADAGPAHADQQPDWLQSEQRQRSSGGTLSAGDVRSATGAVDLDEISRMLDSAPCNPLWEGHIRRLVREVQRLREIIDVVSRVSNCERRNGNDGSEQDTIIG